MLLNGEVLWEERWLAFAGLTYSYALVELPIGVFQFRVEHANPTLRMAVLAYGHGFLLGPEEGYGFQAGFASKTLQFPILGIRTWWLVTDSGVHQNAHIFAHSVLTFLYHQYLRVHVTFLKVFQLWAKSFTET